MAMAMAMKIREAEAEDVDTLISGPSFVHRSSDDDDDDELLQVANLDICILRRSDSPPAASSMLQVLPENHHLSCDFLNQQWSINMVFFAFNDLLLTTSLNRDNSTYGTINLCISNLLTKECYKLPQPPPCYFGPRIVCFRGCIGSIHDPTQYKVVLATRPHQRQSDYDGLLDFYVFSSDTNGWSNFHGSTPPNFGFVTVHKEAASQYATALNGSLYWCTNMILVYDPFTNPHQCDSIDFPQGVEIQTHERKNTIRRSVCITNVEQHLRLYYWCYITAATQTITVWDMNNDHYDRSWSIKHFVDLTSIDWGSINISTNMQLSIKGFNPSNGDVLYVFTWDNRLLAVNLRSKTVRLVSDFSSPTYQISSLRLFFYAQPSRPTPILS